MEDVLNLILSKSGLAWAAFSAFILLIYKRMISDLENVYGEVITFKLLVPSTFTSNPATQLPRLETISRKRRYQKLFLPQYLEVSLVSEQTYLQETDLLSNEFSARIQEAANGNGEVDGSQVTVQRLGFRDPSKNQPFKIKVKTQNENPPLIAFSSMETRIEGVFVLDHYSLIDVEVFYLTLECESRLHAGDIFIQLQWPGEHTLVSRAFGIASTLYFKVWDRYYKNKRRYPQI